MSQESIELTLEPRTVIGKQVRGLRRDGIVPAVIHDHGKDSVLVQGEAEMFRKIIQKAGKHHPIKLTAGGKKYTAMVKDVAVEPKQQRMTHVVLNSVSATEKVSAEVPVRPRYNEGNESSPAERSGFMVLTHLDTVNIEAIASKLPDVLEYDAEKLVEVGDSITVADLIAPSGVEIVSDESQTIAVVSDPAAIEAANDAAGGDAETADAGVVEAEQGAVHEDELSKMPEEAKPDEAK